MYKHTIIDKAWLVFFKVMPVIGVLILVANIIYSCGYEIRLPSLKKDIDKICPNCCKDSLNRK